MARSAGSYSGWEFATRCIPGGGARPEHRPPDRSQRMEAKFRDRVEGILGDRSTLSLATAGSGGETHLADLFFSSDPSLTL